VIFAAKIGKLGRWEKGEDRKRGVVLGRIVIFVLVAGVVWLVLVDGKWGKKARVACYENLACSAKAFSLFLLIVC
jgi:hypothetical protein